MLEISLIILTLLPVRNKTVINKIPLKLHPQNIVGKTSKIQDKDLRFQAAMEDQKDQ
jgi:hypothetical protein